MSWSDLIALSTMLTLMSGIKFIKLVKMHALYKHYTHSYEGYSSWCVCESVSTQIVQNFDINDLQGRQTGSGFRAMA